MAYKILIDCSIELQDETAADTNSVIKYRQTKTITSLDEKWEYAYKFNNETKVVWDPTTTGQEPTSFDFLCILTDSEIEVEMTTNEGDGNEELMTFKVSANIPFMLGADDSWYNHSASNAWGGTEDVIDRIRIREFDSNDANVRLILGKL